MVAESRIWFLAALLGALLELTPAMPAGAAPPIAAGFESPEIDRSIWWLGQIRPDRLSIDHEQTRRGQGALAIRVEPADRDCGGRCQRSEIRVANRLRFGKEAWYGFSFRIGGEFSEHGSKRSVIGQWKQDGDGSPFLAQRFDNGVFHITVQDNDCRVVVAQANGHPDGEHAHRSNLAYKALTFLSDPHVYDCKTDIRIEHGKTPVLPDPRGKWVDMLYRVRGGRGGRGLIEIWANGEFIARVRGSIGYDDAAGPTQYFKIGLYRDPAAVATTLYFDDFRRGHDRDSVDRR